MRQPDRQEGAVELQFDVVPQNGNQRDLQGNNKEGHHHGEEGLTPGELQPGKTISCKGGDKDGDDGSRHSHREAVEESPGEVISLVDTFIALVVDEHELLARQNVLIVIEREVGVGRPLPLLHAGRSRAPVAEPHNPAPVLLHPLAQLLEGTADAIKGHHALPIHFRSRLDAIYLDPGPVGEDGPPTRCADIPTVTEGRDEETQRRNSPDETDQEQGAVDQEIADQLLSFSTLGSLRHQNASVSANCFKL